MNVIKTIMLNQGKGSKNYNQLANTKLGEISQITNKIDVTTVEKLHF